MGALPKALARRGHRTMVVVPRYSSYEEGWETGVRIRLRVCGQDVEVCAVPPPLQPRQALLLFLAWGACCAPHLSSPSFLSSVSLLLGAQENHSWFHKAGSPRNCME